MMKFSMNRRCDGNTGRVLNNMQFNILPNSWTVFLLLFFFFSNNYVKTDIPCLFFPLVALFSPNPESIRSTAGWFFTWNVRIFLHRFAISERRGSSVGRAPDFWWGGPGFDPRCGRPLPTGWDRSHGLPALSRVWQHVKLSDVSLGTRPRYKQTNKSAISGHITNKQVVWEKMKSKWRMLVKFKLVGSFEQLSTVLGCFYLVARKGLLKGITLWSEILFTYADHRQLTGIQLSVNSVFIIKIESTQRNGITETNTFPF